MKPSDFKKSNQSRFSILFSFQLFLWWGTERIKVLLYPKQKEAKIIHAFSSEYLYASSLWIFEQKRGYCLTYLRSRCEVGITLMPGMESN